MVQVPFGSSPRHFSARTPSNRQENPASQSNRREFSRVGDNLGGTVPLTLTRSELMVTSEWPRVAKG